MDRRTFLARAGAGALLAATPLGWELVTGSAEGRAGPRVRELARQLRGPVYVPGNRAYRAASQIFNTRYSDIRPTAVAVVDGPADVAACIRWAQRYGVPIAAKSGGHSYGGYSTTTGLQVNLRRLNRISINTRARTATIGAGTQLLDMYQALARRGVTVPGGSCPTVGIAGLAQGGGMGVAARMFGTTADNILSAEVVTADGQVRQVSPRQNPNLYWAIRGGGGGNFGIVTSFVFRIHPVGPGSWFLISWPWSEAVDAVGGFQEHAPDAPPELYTLCSLSTGSGGPSVFAYGQYFGGQAAMRRALRPLLNAAGGAQLQSGTLSYFGLMLRWAGCGGETVQQCINGPAGTPQPFKAKSDYVDRPMSRRGRETAVQWIERRQRQPGGGAYIMDSYGGAVNEVAPSATAFVHRRALYSIQYYASFGAPAQSLSWIRQFYAAMRPFVSGFAYQNYIDPDLANWQRAYYGSNLPRLQRVKAQYDPDNLFRFRQSIPLPSGGGSSAAPPGEAEADSPRPDGLRGLIGAPD